MNEIWNNIMESKRKSAMILIVVVLVLLGVLFNKGVLDAGKLAFWNNGNNSASIAESDFIQDLLDELEARESMDSSDDNSEMDKISDMTEVVNGLTFFKKVNVPVLANPDLFDYEGKKTQGCGDEIVWVMKDIIPTRAPLTASINLLLNDTKDYGFMPGNFISKQSELSLDNVVIEDSVAKISLDGEFTVDGICDAPRQFIQLEEVALQYSTVSAVQIFLNGELLR